MATTLPIIRLEIEGIKHSVVRMLDEHLFQIDADVREAVERLVTPDIISGAIAREVANVMDIVIKEEVDRYYRYGEGRAAIKAAIIERLSR